MLQKKMMNVSLPGWKFLVIIVLVSGLVIPGYGKPTGKNGKTKNDCVIIFDAFDGLSENNIYKVNKGGSVEMRVTNVNPFLYRARISGKQFDYFPDIPAALKLTKAEKAQKGDVQSVLSKINKGNQDAINKFEKVRETFLNAYNKFIEAYNKLIEIPKFHAALRSVLLKNKPYHQLKSEVKNLIELEIRDVSDPRDIDVINRFNDWLVKARKAYNLLDMEEFLTSLDNLGNDDAHKAWKKAMEAYAKKLQLYKKEIDRLEEKDVIGAIAGLFTKFLETNFTRSRVFPSVNADEVRITVEIEAKNDDVSPPKVTLSGPIKVRVKGGTAINFSTGIFSIFSQRGFYLKDMEDDPGKVELLQDKKISFNPMIIALLHAYPRRASGVNFPVLTFGIGTKDVEHISYFLGTSLIMGTKRRFIVTFGVVLTKLDVLKLGYRVGDTLTKSDDLKIENLLEEEFRPRFALGISYNLTPQE